MTNRTISAARFPALLLTVAAATACGGGGGEGRHEGAGAARQVERPATPWVGTGHDLLVNPGFEVGEEGWTYMRNSRAWGAFAVVEKPVLSGRRSAHLPVHWPADGGRQPVKVFGVVQEVTAEAFPDRLAGAYRVESWESSDPATKLYVQVVVIVWGDPRTGRLVAPEADPPPEIKNYQIRYYLAGVTEPPFVLRNARFKFVDRLAAPNLGRWVTFDIPVRQDFEELWGTVPEGFEFVRVLFEARWDGKPDAASVRADVYYDDLFFGFRGD